MTLNRDGQTDLIFRDIHVDGYERVVEVIGEKVGLRAIIAIHDTRLGPALGGVRAYPYQNFDDALVDVLRLSRGMTYKAAVAGTGTGGGKSVLIADSAAPKSEALLLAFAEAVNYFGGQYICAEDIGMSPADLSVVRKGTRYAVGLPHPKSSGDPSPFTAHGGWRGIQAACQAAWGSPSVRGKTVAVQGLGAVGMKLANTLFWHGAHLIVADPDASRVAHAVRNFGAEAVSTDEIQFVNCDIFTPCALGGILNENTIPRMKCRVVAGLANNQLLTDQDGWRLHEKNILYAPDYVINGGGLHNVCVELEEGGYHPKRAFEKVDSIYDLLIEIFDRSKKENKPTQEISHEIGEERLHKGTTKRTLSPIFHH